MSEQQRIDGYKALPDEEVALVNKVKAGEKSMAALWHEIRSFAPSDPRQLAIAQRHFEDGCTALVKAITRPESPFAVDAA